MMWSDHELHKDKERRRRNGDKHTHTLTFCHRDSLEAKLEHAATNQQLPSCPWCKSCALMPSTNRWGSSHSSYTPKDTQRIVQRSQVCVADSTFGWFGLMPTRRTAGAYTNIFWVLNLREKKLYECVLCRVRKTTLKTQYKTQERK